MNASHRTNRREEQLLHSLRQLSQPERAFISRAIEAMAQHRAIPEQAPEGGNPQGLATTKEKHHA